MKFSIFTTTLMASTLISMGEAVHVKNMVKTHLKSQLSPAERIESKKVDCETDADCVSHGGSCALTQLEWSFGTSVVGETLAEREKSNRLDTCAATAMCGTKSEEINDGVPKTRYWYCGNEKA